MDFNDEIEYAIDVCESHLYKVELAWIEDRNVLPEAYRIEKVCLSDASRLEWFTFNELQCLLMAFYRRWSNVETIVLSEDGSLQILVRCADTEILAFNIEAVADSS